jgi:alpha-ketoglutarate-dependent 2,4-dichlorophenoxyacetate dioxygenase
VTSLTLYPVTPDFAAEIGDLDLSRPLDAATVAAIKQAFWRYAVLIFPDQALTPEQHLAFAGQIGPLEPVMESGRAATDQRLRAELADVSNLMPDGSIWVGDGAHRFLRLGDRLWHTDSSFKPVPALASLLYGKSIAPVGGFTEFADERAAWDALSPDLRNRIEDLVGEHSFFAGRQRYGCTDFPEAMIRATPPAWQALVRTLPETGRTTLYLASHLHRIAGLADTEALALVDQLIAHATQPQFVYRHRWRTNDLVMWDNRCTMHRGTDFDDTRWARDIQRATVADKDNSCVQEGLAIPA